MGIMEKKMETAISGLTFRIAPTNSKIFRGKSKVPGPSAPDRLDAQDLRHTTEIAPRQQRIFPGPWETLGNV